MYTTHPGRAAKTAASDRIAQLAYTSRHIRVQAPSPAAAPAAFSSPSQAGPVRFRITIPRTHAVPVPFAPSQTAPCSAARLSPDLSPTTNLLRSMHIASQENEPPFHLPPAGHASPSAQPCVT